MILADILIWPSVGEGDIAWLIVFILFMGITFYVINSLFRKQKMRTDSRGFAYSEIIGKNFSPDESKILKKFIDSLPNQSKEILSQTKDWKVLRKSLFNYLLEAPNITPELAVRIYDRLYLGKTVNHSFHVQDLNVGEIAALITPTGEELTRIVKNTTEDLLLSSPKSLIGDGKKNIEAKVYVFRPKQGGYFIPGIIVGAINHAILFHINGKPEHAGHAHLMIQEKFQIEINNWPLIENDELEDSVFLKITQNEESEIQDDLKLLESEIRKRFQIGPKKIEKLPDSAISEKEKLEQNLKKNQNINFFCLSLKLSDRGLLFELPQDLESNFWKKSDLWEAKFQMPGGRYVVSKGKIFPSTGSDTRFIFKFVDMDESERVQIYEDIKKIGGEREILK
ncbi:MAG: hypothetical protein JJT78_16735 [Leptospira sp.]|nr:hypothetical protein [Leptospira sp.]